VTDAPRPRHTSAVEKQSALVRGFRMTDSPQARVAMKTARVVFDFEPGMVMVPFNVEGDTMNFTCSSLVMVLMSFVAGRSSTLRLRRPAGHHRAAAIFAAVSRRRGT